jgi:hypothetical protein
MEMCPYCGEEVPADTAKCWKCGTELSEGSGKAPGDDLEVPEEEPDDAGAAPKKSRKMIPCPHCESPVPANAVRCKECGRPVREGKGSQAGAAWRMGTWLVVVGFGVAVAIAVVVVAYKRRHEGKPRPLIPIAYAELERRMTPLQPSTQGERRRELWTRDFEGKFVKWSGVVIQVHEDTGHVDVAHTKGSKKAEADVELRDDARADLGDLKPDQPIVYSARLVEFGKDGFAFTLSEGLIEK